MIEKAETNQQYGKQTIVFLDEIHRRNKAQQDALLPYVEK
jgi:putative ATPase